MSIAADSRSPIGENGEGPFVDTEWLRAVDDLNKEFADHIRDNGTVVVGREVGCPASERFIREIKERSIPSEKTPRAPKSSAERVKRWRQAHRDEYNARQRAYRARKKAERD